MGFFFSNWLFSSLVTFLMHPILEACYISLNSIFLWSMIPLIRWLMHSKTLGLHFIHISSYSCIIFRTLSGCVQEVFCEQNFQSSGIRITTLWICFFDYLSSWVWAHDHQEYGTTRHLNDIEALASNMSTGWSITLSGWVWFYMWNLVTWSVLSIMVTSKLRSIALQPHILSSHNRKRIEMWYTVFRFYIKDKIFIYSYNSITRSHKILHFCIAV